MGSWKDRFQAEAAILVFFDFDCLLEEGERVASCAWYTPLAQMRLLYGDPDLGIDWPQDVRLAMGR